MREAEIPDPLVASFREITVRARQGKREEGFSAALEEPSSTPQPTCLVVICRDRTGAVIGFQRYSSCSGDTKLSVDAMRRLPSAPNGITERMIFEVLQWGRATGSSSSPSTSWRSGSSSRAWMWLRETGPRLASSDTSIPRAHHVSWFTEKFRPRWVPRYLAYRSLSDIPKFAIATLTQRDVSPRGWRISATDL